MKRYRFAVCKGSDCKKNGADAVLAAARKLVAEHALAGQCEVYRGGCYGLCHLGPNVVVREDTGAKRDPLAREDYQLMGWPHEAYYWAMTPEKVGRILAEHVREGRKVEELLGDPRREDDFRKKDPA